MVSLVDELVLLAYDDVSGRNRAHHLELGLGGAVVLELTMAERIDVVNKKIQVVDATPVGDRLLDEVLRRVADDRPRKPAAVVQRAGKGMTQPVLDDLVSRGVLQFKRDKLLGVFPFHRYLPDDPAVEADARARLVAAVDAEAASDARTAALASLVYALKMHAIVFPARSHREVRKSLKAIADGSWAGDATRKAVEATQSAVMAAVMVAAASAGSAQSG
ncbi:GPP34 family phosphoprotein [Glycomyces sp. L485]|uniref:GOLPH3/VPS74 family protein n=1 Tax=Glycomyces sp. L485 TaxID=2909235 RepID=UPI001F4B58A7|nr:GPP34 family phosphoprotein [Glycomyces sp. L485]MCH7229275.1 GPP34 family phosphoprotein [Glycomyces sp. L485]